MTYKLSSTGSSTDIIPIVVKIFKNNTQVDENIVGIYQIPVSMAPIYI